MNGSHSNFNGTRSYYQPSCCGELVSFNRLLLNAIFVISSVLFMWVGYMVYNNRLVYYDFHLDPILRSLKAIGVILGGIGILMLLVAIIGIVVSASKKDTKTSSSFYIVSLIASILVLVGLILFISQNTPNVHHLAASVWKAFSANQRISFARSNNCCIPETSAAGVCLEHNSCAFVIFHQISGGLSNLLNVSAVFLVMQLVCLFITAYLAQKSGVKAQKGACSRVAGTHVPSQHSGNAVQSAANLQKMNV